MHVSGKMSKDTAVYPRKLCRAILKGLCTQLKEDGRLQRGIFGIDDVHEPDGVEVMKVEGELSLPAGCSRKYKDDLSGQPLRDDLVTAARRKELDYFNSKSVWTKRLRQEAYDKTHRPPI